MIFYSPTDGDVHTGRIEYRPRTCFLMTKLGRNVPDIVTAARTSLTELMAAYGIVVMDADAVVTGRDYLTKIWRMLLSVPLGIAIIYKGMPQGTLANIFYEIGLMQAYGKETLLIKESGTKVPSDFVRTEYVVFDADFTTHLKKFLDTFFEQAEHYDTMAEQLETNPLLAIDYLRRSFLISGNESCREKARRIFGDAGLTGRARNSVEMLLTDF
jgi:hypothetical protein